METVESPNTCERDGPASLHIASMVCDRITDYMGVLSDQFERLEQVESEFVALGVLQELLFQLEDLLIPHIEQISMKEGTRPSARLEEPRLWARIDRERDSRARETMMHEWVDRYIRPHVSRP